jgi:hypothetical protein
LPRGYPIIFRDFPTALLYPFTVPRGHPIASRAFSAAVGKNVAI